jgi:hypothetical protein
MRKILLDKNWQFRESDLVNKLWTEYSSRIDAVGGKPLYFVWKGESLIEFLSFRFENKGAIQ